MRRWVSTLGLVAGSAFAADYFVSPAGSDASGDGGAAAPWATISKADTALAPGDTVHALPGDYAAAAVHTTKDGTPSQRITFVSEPRGAAKLHLSNPWSITGAWVDIRGFDLSGDGVTAEVFYVEAAGVRLVGNELHDVATSPPCVFTAAIYTNGGAGYFSGLEVNGNRLHDIGPPPPASCNNVAAIEIGYPGSRITNNIVYRVGGEGIELYGGPYADTIANNLVFDIAGGGILIGGPRSAYAGAAANACSCDDDSVVFNNLVLRTGVVTGSHGIHELGTMADLGPHLRVEHNLLFGNRPNDTVLMSSDAGVAQLNLAGVDPLLVRFDGGGDGDFHLSPSSPAIDAGVGASPSASNPGLAPDDDFDGVARVGRWDLGPFQFTSDAGSSVTSDAGSSASGPVANIAPASQSVAAGVQVRLDASSSSAPSGATLVTYTWTQPRGPTGVALTATPQQSLQLVEPGHYVFRLAVTDSNGRTSPPVEATVEVTEVRVGCGCGSSATPLGLALVALAQCAARRHRGGARWHPGRQPG